MKNKELASFVAELKKLNLTGKVAYAIAKNRRLVETELEVFKNMLEEHDDFKAYDKERLELIANYTVKDANGKPVIEGNQFKIEDEVAWEKALKPLQEKYKDAIEKRDKQIEDYNKLMGEESKLTLYTIKEEDIPENATSQEIYTLLKFVV